LQARPDDVVVRYDPSLDRAIDLALGNGLLMRRGGGILALTGTGKSFVELLGNSNVLKTERDFLSDVRPVKQAFVEQLLPGRAG
jgi:hypothetical protein